MATAGYWFVAVKRLFPDAYDIDEDWKEKTVQFSLRNPTASLIVPFSQLKQLASELQTDTIILTINGDNSYADQHAVGAIMEVTASAVQFPQSAH